MKKRSFAERVAIAKTTTFNIPPDVKCHKHLMPNGKWSYVFRHDNLGELGRIFFLPRGAQSQICCEAAGEPDDPMTKKRLAILEPISKDVIDKMVLVCGEGRGSVKPYVSPKDRATIAGWHYHCDTCGALAAMLIFAPDYDTKAGLEDHARIMYSKAKELNVPIWIVGTETEYIVNGEDLRKSLVLKMYPKHEEARIMTPDDLMEKINKLMATHCKNNKIV